ncbi:FAD-dependent oxidoreductase [Streptomyces sp. NPDC035033]|uniref:FAD-dependent oxidoreductase n=1 Tax=Streptomyces sp. NPDC035033 TaxID=3155368 RepID=UPI0033DA13AE
MSTTDTRTGDRPTTDTDVIVVGAGPTGLLLAGDLAAAGLRVTLVERRPAGRSNLTRAFGVHARTLELLDTRGLADALEVTGTRLTRMRLFGHLSLDLSRLPSRYNHLLITPQYEVERLLEQRAADAGVTFRHGTALDALQQDADGVTAHLTDPDGTPRTLRAHHLVGTDGHRSTVRTALGLPFPGTSVIRSIVLADVRLTDEPAASLTVNGNGDTFAFVAPFGDGWYRVMGWDRTRQVPDSEPVDLDEVRALARRALGTDHGMHDARWISRFHSDERQAPAYRVGRVFLAGDAAHVHSPAGGQGMNTGLQDAANLSWKLIAVHRGEAPDPEALLDSYQAERHPVGAMVLRTSGALIRLAMAHTPATRALRALATTALDTLRPASAKALGTLSGLGISYAPAPGGGRTSGRRAPDVALREGRLHALLRAGEFVLITPQGAAPALPPTAPTTTARTVHATWPDPARRTTVLVRPDGYVLWTDR